MQPISIPNQNRNPSSNSLNLKNKQKSSRIELKMHNYQIEESSKNN
jgi:hypothetical protein